MLHRGLRIDLSGTLRRNSCDETTIVIGNLLKYIKLFSTKLKNTLEGKISESVLSGFYGHENEFYPPKEPLVNLEINSYIASRLGKILKSSIVPNEKEQIQIPEKAQTLMKKDKIDILSLRKIVEDCHESEDNYRKITPTEERIAKKICPDIDLDNIKVKTSPFKSSTPQSISGTDILKVCDAKSHTLAFIDRRNIMYALQKDYYNFGLIDILDYLVTEEEVINHSKPIGSFLRRERHRWNFTESQKNPLQFFELFFKAYSHLSSQPEWDLHRIHPYCSAASSSHGMKCLIPKKLTIGSNSEMVKRDADFSYKQVNQIVDLIVKRIAYWDEWQWLDIKMLLHSVRNASQRQTLEKVYQSHVYLNLRIYHSKRQIYSFLGQLIQLAPYMYSIYSVYPWESKKLTFFSKEERQFAKLHIHADCFITFEISHVLPLDMALEALTDISDSLLNDNNIMDQRILSLDHLYLFLSKKIGSALNNFCRRNRHYKLIKSISQKYQDQGSDFHLKIFILRHYLKKYILRNRNKKHHRKIKLNSLSLNLLHKFPSVDGVLLYLTKFTKDFIKIDSDLYWKMSQIDHSTSSLIITKKFKDDLNKKFRNSDRNIIIPYIEMVGRIAGLKRSIKV